MFEDKRSIVAMVATALFAVAFGMPASASAGEDDGRVVVRANFDSTLNQTQRVGFVDDKEDDFEQDNIVGYVAAHEKNSLFVLEGLETSLRDAVGDLHDDSRLDGVEVVSEEVLEATTFNSIVTHTELDTRDEVAATGTPTKYKRTVVQVELSDNLTDSQAVSWHDGYFTGFDQDGLGGLFVNGNGNDLITLEFEGKPEYVDDWLQQISSDVDVDTMDVLHSDYTTNAGYTDLVGHVPSDERDFD